MRRLQYLLRALLLLVLLAALASAGAAWWRRASLPPVVAIDFDGDLDLFVRAARAAPNRAELDGPASPGAAADPARRGGFG
jgi:hypothetical protein